MSGLAAQGVHADNVFMSFAVTSDSHTLDAYRARGGYEALGKALRTLQPEDVERRGHRLRAARPGRGELSGGREVVVREQAEPGRVPVLQRRRRRAGNVQGPLDPRARSASARRRHPARRLRVACAACVRVHPRRVRPAAAPAARGAAGGACRRARRRGHSRQCIRVRHRRSPRRRRLRVRRGVEPHQLARGKEGIPAQQAAVSRRQGLLRRADRRQQRRDAGQRALDHRARRRGLRRARQHRRIRAIACSASRGTSTGPACTSGRPAIR